MNDPHPNVYTYRCEAGHVTRIRQEAPTGCIRCPECGRDAVRQVATEVKS